MTEPGRSRSRVNIATALIGLALMALSVCSANAVAAAPDELLRIPRFVAPEKSDGTGLLDKPSGIATSPATGHVFVVDALNNRINEYTSWGEFVKSWGWGVVAAGPDDDPQNEIQQVSVDASGGTFKLRLLSEFEAAPAIPWNASAATVQGAVEELEAVDPGDVTVSGPDGGPWVVEFVGRRADTDVARLQASSTELTGGTGSVEVKTQQPGANFEVCIAANGDICKRGQLGNPRTGEFTAPGQFTEPHGIALGPDGSVYVYEYVGEGFKGSRVQKFSPAGEFLLMFGGEVNKTSAADVCTKADLEAGDECGMGVQGTGPGEFQTSSEGNYIAVSVDGTVNVGDLGRIQKFGADGSFIGEIQLEGQLQGKQIEELTIDGDGNFYVVVDGPPIGSNPTTEGAFKLSPTGQLIGPEFPVYEPGPIAVDAAGNVYLVEDPTGFGGDADEPRVVVFGPGGEVIVPGDAGFAGIRGRSTFGVGYILGLGTNVLGNQGQDASIPGDLYVSAFYPSSPSESFVTVYGPLPRFEPAPPAPPTITEQYATEVGPTTATVGATINPHFFASTTYYVEYGPGKCSEGGCSSTAPALLGAERDRPAATAPITLGDLEPGTTYNYRFVAVSGPYTSRGLGEGEAGDEATFTTGFVHEQRLPDGRAYEMVSPPQKNNGDVPLASLPFSVVPLQSSPEGNAITYSSFTAFGEAPSSSPSASQYISRRNSGGGWSTQNLTPPDEESYLTDPLRGFSQNLSKAAVITLEPPLLPSAAPGYENLYVMSTGDESLQLATPGEPRIQVQRDEYCVEFAGASADFSRIIFASRGALIEGDPEPLVADAFNRNYNLYEWSVAEGLRLVSVLPNDKAAQPKDVTGFGAGTICGSSPEHLLAGAISSDGSKIFWKAGGKLYARVDGKDTIQLDLKQGGSASGGGTFWRASADGSKAFFTSPNPLTPGAGNDDLYRYDFGAPVGSRLTNVSSGGGVLGVLGTGADGNTVYFSSGKVLAPNQGPGGGEAQGGKPNLYLWRQDDGLKYVATLSVQEFGFLADRNNWTDRWTSQTARVTPDGRHLAFLSLAPLNGSDNAGQSEGGRPAAQVYLYDAVADELRCASCTPSGTRPIGDATLPTWSTPFDQPRYLSDDGRRVFFQSIDPLEEHDTNSKVDVYEFELAGAGSCSIESPTYSSASGGCINLISSGKSQAGATFLDASTSGDDAFIATRERLVSRDEDDNQDVYDVKVGGSEPPLPEAPVLCEGEACRGIGSQAPQGSLPGTSAFQGPGNPKPSTRCRKPRRKVTRGGKTRCVKPKKQKRGKSRPGRHHKKRR
jgi:hypothetical protein